MLAREDEEQAQEKMLEQFEQSLEHLDKAGITSIEVPQSVIEDGNDSDSSISSTVSGICCLGACISPKLTCVTQSFIR